MTKIKIKQSFESLSEESQEIILCLFFQSDKNGYYDFEEEDGTINTYRIAPHLFKEIKNTLKSLEKKGFLIKNENPLDDSLQRKYKINVPLVEKLGGI